MICIEHFKCCNLDFHVECASKNTPFIFLISDLYRNNCLLIYNSLNEFTTYDI